jgi:hypothetical protein
MTTTHTDGGVNIDSTASFAAMVAIAQERGVVMLVPAEVFARMATPAAPAFVERRQGDRRGISERQAPATSNEMAVATVEAVAAVPPAAVRRFAGRKRVVHGREQHRARYRSALRSNADLDKLELSNRRRQVVSIVHDAGDEGITCKEIKTIMAKREGMKDPEDMHGTVTQVLHWLKTNAPKPLIKVDEDTEEDVRRRKGGSSKAKRSKRNVH